MTETLIVQNVAYILASLSEGEWFSYLYSVQRKFSYKLDKMDHIHKLSHSYHHFICSKNIESETNFDVIFGLKRSLHKLRKINETMNPKFGLGHEI